jgi:hypothetical protein
MYMSRSLALFLASVLTLPGIPSLAQDSAGKSHREPMTTKMAVERPVEKLFPLSSPIPVGLGAALKVPQSKNASVNNEPIANKQVPPGLVAWRKDFATACSLSERSGKPVLLFQMMGKLDDEFC